MTSVYSQIRRFINYPFFFFFCSPASAEVTSHAGVLRGACLLRGGIKNELP